MQEAEEKQKASSATAYVHIDINPNSKIPII